MGKDADVSEELDEVSGWKMSIARRLACTFFFKVISKYSLQCL